MTRTIERERQEAELNELRGMDPPPTDADWMADRDWIDRESLRPGWSLFPINIEVLDKNIVGTGPDRVGLQLQVAREDKVHPDRVVAAGGTALGIRVAQAEGRARGGTGNEGSGLIEPGGPGSEG